MASKATREGTSRTGDQHWLAAALLILLVGLGLHASGITGVHGWSDDGSAYLRHALNILEGRPYNQIPYANIGEQSPAIVYPPVLPLLLTPLIQIWGIDFRVFQFAMLGVFMLAAVVTLAALGRTFSKWTALAAVALLVLDSELGTDNQHINSDFLGLLWVAAFVWWVEGFDWRAQAGRALAWRSGIAAALLILAIETRTVNAIFLAAVPLCSLWRYRKLTTFAWITPTVAIISVALMSTGSSSADGYLRALQSVFSLAAVRRNIIQYSLSLSDFMGMPNTGGSQWIALAAMAVAIYGAFCLARTARPIWLLTMGLYAPVLLVWPYSDPIRFLIPTLPMLLACFVHGTSTLTEKLPERTGSWIRVGLPLLVLLSSARAYALLPPIESGLNSPASLEMYQAVQQMTAPKSVIASRKPRSLSLFTKRYSVTYSHVAPADMRQEFCEAGVTHVVSAPATFIDDEQYIEPMLAEGGFELLFQNSEFSIYRMTLPCR
ncbi:MAG: hypothetical protein ABIR70_09000 [Bryobacteraceae bacterium]